MAGHNPPYLFELDGNTDPEELFEVGDHSQAVMLVLDRNYNILIRNIIFESN